MIHKALTYSKVLILVMLTGLVSCVDSMPDPQPSTSPVTGRARVQVVNLVPGAEAFTIQIDNEGSQTAEYASQTEVMANYQQVTAGTRQIRLRSGNVTRPVVASSNFQANANHTLFVTDTITRPGAGADPGGPRALLVADNLAAPAAGRAHVRFLQMAPNAGTIGLFEALTNLALASPRGYRATATAPAVTPSVNFVAFTPIDARPYLLEAKAGATTTAVAGPTLVNFEEGGIYTVVLRGVRGRTGNEAPGLTIIKHN
jgi:hypothetical protein